MSANQKRTLLTVTYYTLIAVMIAFVIFHFITLANSSMAMWERIMLYVVTALLLVVTVYDIFCTMTHRQKYIAGFVLFGITLAVVILSLVIMAINSDNGRLLIEITEKFFRIILFTYVINALAVIIYLNGEKLINNDAHRKSGNK